MVCSESHVPERFDLSVCLSVSLSLSLSLACSLTISLLCLSETFCMQETSRKRQLADAGSEEERRFLSLGFRGQGLGFARKGPRVEG